jgi:aspartyl-tRNA(Asn)/glutamyl-tRNA(Gln) amidotransferase subunit B
LNEHNKSISELPITAKSIADIISLIDKGIISNSAATQQLFPALLNNLDMDMMEIVKDLNLMIDADTDVMGKCIEDVISQYPEKVIEYNNGKKAVLGLFMGEVMRLTKGKIDPKVANGKIIKKLESLK